MIYLASPYSHPDKEVQEHRYKEAQRCIADMLSKGLHAISPIVHCHDLAARFNLPGTAEFWRLYNEDVLRRCNVVRVFTLPGWEESKGVEHEVRYALGYGIPVLTWELEYHVSHERFNLYLERCRCLPL